MLSCKLFCFRSPLLTGFRLSFGIVKEPLKHFLHFFCFRVKREGISPLPGVIWHFEKFGVVGCAFFEFVAERLNRFPSGVAEFEVLASVTESEGSVFRGEFF